MISLRKAVADNRLETGKLYQLTFADSQASIYAHFQYVRYTHKQTKREYHGAQEVADNVPGYNWGDFDFAVVFRNYDGVQLVAYEFQGDFCFGDNAEAVYISIT